MKIRQFFLFFLSASIITSAISVSLSQGFLALAFIAFLLLRDSILPMGKIFRISLLFWGLELLGLLVHFGLSGWDFSYLKAGYRSEPKDVFLYLGFVCMTRLRKEDLPLVYKSFVGFAMVHVAAGFVSMFSEYRLGWLFSSLHREMTTWGKQHLQGVVGSVKIYLPIGLMNTHLTYGGLLLLVYPWIFYRTLLAFEKKEGLRRILLWGLFLGLASIVFLVNNARSSIAGAGIGILVGYFLWRNRGFRLQIPLWIPLATALLVLVSSMVLWKSSESFRTVVGPILGSEKHTDSGRSFIWSSTFPMIRDNPVLGVGPGNYPNEIEKSRKNLSREYPNLLFFYETTQRGHAHNDYFHLAAVFGMPTLLVYLGLVYLILLEIFRSRLPFPEIGLFLGLVGFFFASLLQCYFQDDEVVILFWYLVGYLYQSNRLDSPWVDSKETA